MPTKASITTRAAAGQPLSQSQMDGNLEALRDQSIGFADDTSTVLNIDSGSTITIAGGDSVSTAISGSTLTVDLDEAITVDSITAGDSSAISVQSPVISSSTIKFNGEATSVSSIKDEDNMSSNSATALSTQQSIKAYADTKTALTGSTNNTVTTVTGANAIQGEANLTFDGTTLGIANTSTSDSVLITSTEDSSTAAPVITLKRNSGSPADADYLGQLKFKGENDADQEVIYAKMTAKISDASDSSEDGLLEFSNIKAGSQTITARLTSTDLKLLNGTGLEVAGDVTTASNGNITLDPNGTGKVIAKITPSTLDTGFVLQDATDGVQLRNLMYLFGSEVTGGSGDNKQMYTRAYDLSGTYTYPSGAASGDVSWNTQYDFTNQAHSLQVYGGDLTLEAFDHNGGSYATKPVNISQLGHYTEKVDAITDDSTADIHVNCLTQGPVATFSLNDNKTFVFQNLPTGRSFTLIIENQGAFTATFQADDSSAIKFPGGTPTVTSGAGKIDVITIFNTGSDVIGNIAQDYS